jgi:hypothetical protein
MQEKKNKRLAILLIVLCTITVLTYFTGRSNDSVDVAKDMFRSYELRSVDAVHFESKADTVKLKFNGSKWVVNDEYNADPTMVQVLFATLQQAEPKRPVSSSLRDSIAETLKRDGVKVSLFSAGKKEIAFHAGGNKQKTQAFFSNSDGDDTPYLMTIPGYRVYVSGIFELKQKDWRDKLVFGFNWRNFESLEAVFPGSPKDGFNVAMADNYFGIKEVPVADTTHLNDFLDDVSLLTAQEFAENQIFSKSEPASPPIMSIKVKDIGQRVYTLDIYQPSAATGHRYIGVINGNQWAFFAPERIRNILKKREYFAR